MATLSDLGNGFFSLDATTSKMDSMPYDGHKSQDRL